VNGFQKMFAHHNIKGFQKALWLWFVASVDSLSIHRERPHSFVDPLARASESIVLNICKRKPYFKDIDLALGKQRLGRVAAMPVRF
jgi:hypothetical protein